MKVLSLLPVILLLYAISVFKGISYAVSILTAVLIHEAGHLLCAKITGVRILSVSVVPQGIKIRFDFFSVSHLKQLLVCLSGSIVGFVFSFIGISLRLYSSDTMTEIILFSMILGALNLLPIAGLDGGEALLCVLDKYYLPDKACRIYKAVSSVTTLIFFAVSVRIQLRNGINVSLMLMSLYFILSALKE